MKTTINFLNKWFSSVVLLLQTVSISWELVRYENSNSPESETQGIEARNQHESPLGDSDAPSSCRTCANTT